jgi:glyoxylase-like metal-dependent hydrolase (beta-lactamase superfamily II)
MLVFHTSVGPFEANCYIVGDNETREAIVIDPGGDATRILDIIEQNKLRISAILNTHGHIDHVAANVAVRQHTGASIGIHPDDAPLLQDPLLNGSAMFGIPFRSHQPDFALTEETPHVVGRLTIRVLHTPGHTQGSICLLMNDSIFTGDTLFKESIGRCDLPGGNAKALQQSLRTKILPLGDSYVVYPGHGEVTNLKHERQRNPFLCKL